MGSYDASLMAQRREQLRHEIETLIRRVPPSYSSWSVQETVQYKEAVKHGRSSINAKNPSVNDMNEALSKLKVWWAKEAK